MIQNIEHFFGESIWQLRESGPTGSEIRQFPEARCTNRVPIENKISEHSHQW